MKMRSERPIIYVSTSCRHCRALISAIERAGVGDSYKFVNVKDAHDLPRFVDRVPLMFDGRDVHTDKALFRMFTGSRPGPSAQMVQPQVSPSSGLLGTFSSSFSALDGNAEHDDVAAGNLWMVDAAHESIETPDAEPMPKKGD